MSFLSLFIHHVKLLLRWQSCFAFPTLYSFWNNNFYFASLDLIGIDPKGFKRTKASLPLLFLQSFMFFHSLHVFEKSMNFLFLHLLFNVSTSAIFIFCEVSLHDSFNVPFDCEEKWLSWSTTKSFFGDSWRGKVFLSCAVDFFYINCLKLRKINYI